MQNKAINNQEGFIYNNKSERKTCQSLLDQNMSCTFFMCRFFYCIDMKTCSCVLT